LSVFGKYRNDETYYSKIGEMLPLWETLRTGYVANIELKLLRNYFKGNSDSMAIDVGVGTGRFIETMHNTGIIGIDVSTHMLNICKKRHDNIQLIRAEARYLPFVDNTFDKILLMRLLPHIPDGHKAVCESFRIMKPNGKMVFDVVNHKSLTTIISSIMNRTLQFHREDELLKKTMILQRKHEYFNFPAILYRFMPKFLCKIIDAKIILPCRTFYFISKKNV